MLQQLHSTQEMMHTQQQWIHAFISFKRKANLKLSLVSWPQGVGCTRLKQSSMQKLVDTSTFRETPMPQQELLETLLIPTGLPAPRQHREISPASNQP